MADHVSQQRVIDAPADRIFAVLTDIRHHPAIDGSGALQGRPEGPNPLVLGSQFSMGMKMHGMPYRTTNTVVEHEPDRRIAWQTASRVRDRIVFGGQVWRWELEARPDGATLVRETFDFSQMRYKPLMNGVMRVDRLSLGSLEGSLRRLAALVETA
ncbi:SRPBCC family protein [Mariniluteicoccus endophyticus]